MPRSVADLCQQQGIDALELSQRTGLDMIRITAIVMGRWTPSPTDRQKVSAALGVSIDEIVWGHATPIQHLYGHGPG